MLVIICPVSNCIFTVIEGIDFSFSGSLLFVFDFANDWVFFFKLLQKY